MSKQEEKQEPKIAKVIHWQNDMVMCFDQYGEQMPEYQGPIEEVEAKIKAVYDGPWMAGDWGSGKMWYKKVGNSTIRAPKLYKFRAWHKTKQQWIEDFMELPLFAGLNMMLNNSVSDAEVVEYTGLPDKNNVEMCQGDILNTKNGIGWIEWDHTKGMWIVQSFSWWCELYKVEEPEVKGNVFEHRELLA